MHDNDADRNGCLDSSMLRDVAKSVIGSLTLNKEAKAAYEDCLFDFSPDCCAPEADVGQCCSGALPIVSCVLSGCSPKEECNAHTGFCEPLVKEITLMPTPSPTSMPTPSPTIEPQVCSRTFNHQYWTFSVFSPRTNADPGSFCQSRGLELARVTSSSLYNELREKTRVWSSTDSPTCEGAGRQGWYTLFKGPHPSHCYTMTSSYAYPHQIPCEWDRSDYGILCQYPVQYQICRHTFHAAGAWFSVYSPRETGIDPHQFCHSRGMNSFAFVNDAQTYNAVRQKLRVWTADNNPTCSGTPRTGWYTRYRGPQSSKCYTMTTSYSFPHEVPCSWSTENYGILCRH